MPSDDRPKCRTCWFSKTKVGTNQFGNSCLLLHCLRSPEVQKKDPDDFCQHHPAWPEYEARYAPDHISDFYADRED